MKQITRFLFPFILMGGLALAQTPKAMPLPPGATDLDTSHSEMQAWIERYSADRSTLSRSFTLPPPPIRVETTPAGQQGAQGRPGPAGMTGGAGGRGGGGMAFGRGGADQYWVLSPEYQERFRKFYTEWQAALQKIDFDAMSQDGKVDYILFRRALERDVRQFDDQIKQMAAVEPLVPFAKPILALAAQQRRRELISGKQAGLALDAIARQVIEARRQVEAQAPPPMRAGMSGGQRPAPAQPSKISREDATRAASAIEGLRSTLTNWFGLYYGYDPEATWWATGPFKQVDQEMQAYATLLRDRFMGRRSDDWMANVVPPIGHDGLVTQLGYEMIPYTPEELIAIANKEYAYCESEMKKASRELGYGDDWLKAIEYVKTKHVEPGQQPRVIRDLADQAVEFIKKNDLITIPDLSYEDWRMEMMSPQRQLVNPFFTGGDLISISYPTDTMTEEQKQMSMRGNNVHFSHATVFHELVPGHHFQGYMRARYRPYRSMFSTSFNGEGWALYWELLMWDSGFDKTPEDRIGALFWRMHRCLRIIFSLSYHLGKMTPQECIDMLVTKGGHERDNATAEVRRSFDGSYPPLYQAAYMIGGLQLRALHKDLVGSGKMTNRQFNDAVIRQGSIPNEMIRAALANVKLTRDYTANWKFYGPIE
jgi:uncharacterized protein (DUF885 family)